MKKCLLVVLTLGLIMVAVFAVLPASTSSASFFGDILNPGFEEPAGSVAVPPSDWVATGTSLGRSTDAYEGDFSADITGELSYYTQTVFAEAATNYEIWGYAKTTECTAYMELTIQDYDHAVLLTDNLAWDNTVWEKKTKYITTPINAYYAVIKLSMTPDQGASSPKARFDNIVMQEPSGSITTNCFIATAAYGTSSAEEIDTLRAFRDEVLLQNSLGSELVNVYYDVSPPVADFISEHIVLRTLVRELLVDPIVSLVEATETLWLD